MGIKLTSKEQAGRLLYEHMLTYASLTGVASSRPAAGVRGRTYFATDTEVLSVDDGTDWHEISGGTGGAVSSVFGRTGDVVAADDDYDASQVNNDSSVTGDTVKDALQTLAGDIITDHGGLSGLSDDDHTQYAKLGGRSSGQTLIGDTAASGNLTLQSTADATRGLIVASDTLRASGEYLDIYSTSPWLRLLESDDSDRVTSLKRAARVTSLISDQVNTIPAVPGYSVQCADTGTKYLQMASTSTAMSGNNFTISAWVYIDSFVSGSTDAQGIWGTSLDGYGAIFRFGNSSSSENQKLCLSFGYGTPGSWSNFCIGTTSVTAGAWHHVVGTYDGSNLKLYLDGALEQTTAETRSVSWGTNQYLVGCDYGPAPSGRALNGRIDEVSVWSKTMNLTEVQAQYNSGNGLRLGGTETNLVYLYHLDDNTGTTAAAGVSGTPALNFVNSPSWGAGKVNISDGSTSNVSPTVLAVQDSTLSGYDAAITLGGSNTETSITGKTLVINPVSGYYTYLRQKSRIANDGTSVSTTTTEPEILATAGSGAAYPWNQAGHLIVYPGQTLSRDILFSTYTGSVRNYPLIVSGDGRIYLADSTPTKDCYLYRDPVGTGSAGVLSTDGWLSVNSSATLTNATVSVASYGAGAYGIFNAAHARGTKASPTTSVTADQIGEMNYVAYSPSGQWLVSAAMRGYVEGTVTTNRVPGRIDFLTQNSTGTLTQGLRLDSSQVLWVGSTVDTNLYRVAANILGTDDGLQLVTATTGIAIGTTPVGRFGIRNSGTKTDASAAIYGFHTDYTASSANILLAGFWSAITCPSTGTTTAIYGGYDYPTIPSGGTVSTRYGMYIANPNVSGTLTTNYGIFVATQQAGGKDYGIVIGGADTQVLWLGSGSNYTTAAGGIAFGISKDTNLYRSAANVLKTDDTLYAATGVMTNGINTWAFGGIATGAVTPDKYLTVTVDGTSYRIPVKAA